MPLDGIFATADPSINVVVVYNPFDLSQKSTHQLGWRNGRTLAEYLIDLPDGIEWAVTVNADLVERGAWHLYLVEENDWIVLMPVPEGGDGGGKGILRLVGLLAVTLAAPYAAGALGFAAGTLGFSLVTSGVARCGSLTVGRL